MSARRHKSPVAPDVFIATVKAELAGARRRALECLPPPAAVAGPRPRATTCALCGAPHSDPDPGCPLCRDREAARRRRDRDAYIASLASAA